MVYAHARCNLWQDETTKQHYSIKAKVTNSC